MASSYPYGASDPSIYDLPTEADIRAENIENWLALIYDDARRELNPDDEECPTCSGDGFIFDCFDGFCVDAEIGCEECTSVCPDCRSYKRALKRRVRVEILRSMNIELATAFLRSEGRQPPETFPKNVLLNLHAGRTACPEFSDEERADSACWVECLQ